MADRYKAMFARLQKTGQGAFIPFTVLGDPDPETSVGIIRSLIKGGADALELGLPFSDPIADGPLIQKASLRALEAGADVAACFRIIGAIRAGNPEIPIGLLVYANLVETGGPGTFFEAAAKAGVDSVLIADIPVAEIGPYKEAAGAKGIQTVLILPLDANQQTIEAVVRESEGYLYLLSRRGVTGVETKAGLPGRAFMQALENLKSAPPVLGFGISSPGQVRAAIKAGCRGAISGSAVVRIIEGFSNGKTNPAVLEAFVRDMKAAAGGAKRN